MRSMNVKNSVALLDAECAEDVGEAVGVAAHVVVGVSLLLAVLAFPEHGGLVAVAVNDMAVYGLVGEVESAAGEPIDLLLHARPSRRRPG